MGKTKGDTYTYNIYYIYILYNIICMYTYARDITAVYPTFPAPVTPKRAWIGDNAWRSPTWSVLRCFFFWGHVHLDPPGDILKRISFEEQNPQEIYSLTPSSSWFFCLVDSRTGWSAGKAHPSHVWLVIVRTKRHLLDFEWSVFNGGCHRGAITNSYQVCDTSSGPEHSSKWRAVMWHWLVVELNAKM